MTIFSLPRQPEKKCEIDRRFYKDENLRLEEYDNLFYKAASGKVPNKHINYSSAFEAEGVREEGKEILLFFVTWCKHDFQDGW